MREEDEEEQRMRLKRTLTRRLRPIGPSIEGERGKDTKEKKKVPGWTIEEMKGRPYIAVEEDTEEMKRWRGLSESEMDLCWKNFGRRKL